MPHTEAGVQIEGLWAPPPLDGVCSPPVTSLSRSAFGLSAVLPASQCPWTAASVPPPSRGGGLPARLLTVYEITTIGIGVAGCWDGPSCFFLGSHKGRAWASIFPNDHRHGHGRLRCDHLVNGDSILLTVCRNSYRWQAIQGGAFPSCRFLTRQLEPSPSSDTFCRCIIERPPFRRQVS